MQNIYCDNYSLLKKEVEWEYVKQDLEPYVCSMHLQSIQAMEKLKLSVSNKRAAMSEVWNLRIADIWEEKLSCHILQVITVTLYHFWIGESKRVYREQSHLTLILEKEPCIWCPLLQLLPKRLIQ